LVFIFQSQEVVFITVEYGESQTGIIGQLGLESAAVTVMDAETGFVVLEESQHQLMYPASTTKVMTALLVLEHAEDLQADLMFTHSAIEALPYYASRMHALPGDVITIEEALYGLMLPSGNDVANALAEYVAGSLEAFVALMNQRAHEIGAYNTNFVNPCGLPGDGQHTTAFDMSLIMREAVQNPIFNQVISAPRFEIQPLANFTEGLEVINTNRMIRPETYEFNPAVIGGKTGFTNAAQHTLVSYSRRGEHSYIVTVLYAPRGATFTDTAALLDYAFTFPVINIYEAGETNFEIPVMQYINGEHTLIDNLALVGEQGLSIPLPTNINIRREVVLPTEISPPVRMGEELGSVSFFAGDNFIGEVPLVASETIFPRIGTLMAADTELAVAHEEAAVPGDSPPNSMVPFFAILPLVTILIAGFIYVMLRRHRNIVKRRRRRMERIKRITESGYITTSRSQYRYEVME